MYAPKCSSDSSFSASKWEKNVSKITDHFPAEGHKTWGRYFFKESIEITDKVLNYWLGALSLSFHPYHFHLPGSTFFVSHGLLSWPHRSLFSTDALDVVTILLTHYWSSMSPSQPAVHSVKPLWALCALFILPSPVKIPV